MITASNVTVQFGEKPLFEDVSVKFGDGHRYGLIGANGSGKTTFMKVLGGELEPTHGNVSVPPHARVGKLRQDQFAFEDFSVIHTVIMGHERLWQLFQERERLYSQPSMSAEEGLRAAELENEFAHLDGYTAEAAAGELLLAVGIPETQHYGPMSAVAPGWKLRVLLAQALFANPDIMLLDEPTNNLDIDAIRWLEGFTSSSTIFSIWRAREVACRDFDAFAEKRLTNAWRSAIWAFFFAFSAKRRSRACVAAIMYSS